MKDDEIIRLTDDLYRCYKTRDPFEIARSGGIHIMLRNDFSKQKGAFAMVSRNPFIFLNGNLPDETLKIVCAHELGHALMHRDIAARPFLEFELFASADRLEYEANCFAASLLMDAKDIIAEAKEGLDAAQIARIHHSHVDLVLILMHLINQQGNRFSLPRPVDQRFMGDIDNHAGTL